MNRSTDDEQLTARLVAAAVVGFLLFVPPLLSAFSHGARLLGVPALWAYLFLAWAAVIGLVAVTIGRSG
jgi:hypothetical protein